MVDNKVFRSIRQCDEDGILSEYYLRLLEKQGRLPGIYVGTVQKKKLVNVPQLLAQLDEASKNQEYLGG